MNHRNDSLALIRNANPVGVDPAGAHTSQARAAFERIVAEPRKARRRPLSLHAAGGPGLRPRLAIGGAGITAVVVALVVAVVSGSSAGPAFAGWRAIPTVASPAQIADAVRQCGVHAPVVLAEARGPYTAIVFAARSGGTACVQGPSMSVVGSIGGVHAPDNPIAADQIGTATITGADSNGDALVLLAGRVGSAVRSIVIHRSNHIDVTATIKRGWYLAWWPARAHATDATVTTTSGTHNIALTSVAPPSCRGSSGGGCAAAAGSFQVGSNGPGSAGVPGPPLIGGSLFKPFHRTLLLQVDNASSVLVCFHPPSMKAAVLDNGPTGPCTHATLLTRLPPHYPVQKNLLELFPKSIWEIKLPPGTTGRFLVVASGTSGFGPARNEVAVNP